MLYGMAASKLADLTDFSEGLVRRAQRWLVAHGYLEREKVGGGRAATKWRVLTTKLFRPAPVAAEQAGRACRMCVGAGPARGGGTYWVRAVPDTQTAITPDQPCDHHAPTQHDDQPRAGSGRALALDVARALPSTHRHASRRNWRGRRTFERTPA